MQFKDALVSSAVVWFKNSKAPEDHAAEFTFAGTLSTPKIQKMIPSGVLRKEPKWTRFPVAAEREISSKSTLGDFFIVKRGLATGDNSFFILSKEQIEALKLPKEVFSPVLPSPRFLKVDKIYADHQGNPVLKPQLFLLDCRLPPDIIKIRYPSLWDYLETGRDKGVSERYLCRNRTLWYVQEDRPPSMFVCTYMGRGANDRNMPFRFILNYSKATVTNTYLMLYPRTAVTDALENYPTLTERIWSALNSIEPDVLREEGRIYGGGLHKIEPRELSNVPAETIKSLLHEMSRQCSGQQELFDQTVVGIRA